MAVDLSTIKPDGTGDYVSLAAWWTAKKNNAAGSPPHAECYTGDVGPLDMTAGTFTPDASNYVRIYAAEGHRHNGSTGGAYAAGTLQILSIGLSYTQVDGIYFVLSATVNFRRCVAAYSITGLVFTNCLFRITSNSTSDGLSCILYQPNTTGTYEILVRNCIFLSDTTTTTKYKPLLWLYPYGDTVGDNVVMNATVQNCTARQASGTALSYCYAYQPRQIAGATATLNVTTTNCIGSKGSSTASVYKLTAIAGGGGTLNNTQTYCISDDATADDWGGAGNMINHAFTDEYTSTTDLTPIQRADLIGMGADLSAQFTTDALGTARKTPWSIGAIEPSFTRDDMSIRTVCDDGLKDFVSLAAWEAWADDRIRPEQWAECYSGELGTVAQGGWVSTPTTTYYSKIYAATGHRHDGVSVGDNGAYITATGVNGIYLQNNYSVVEGIKVVFNATVANRRGIAICTNVSYPSDYTKTGFIIDGCLVVYASCSADDTQGIYAYLRSGQAGSTQTLRVQNTIIHLPDTNTYSSEGIRCNGVFVTENVAFSATYRPTYYNVSVIGNDNAATYGYRWLVYNTELAYNRMYPVTTNCFALGCGEDFYQDTPSGAHSSITTTQTYCLSSDATADDWGGASNQINKTTTDVIRSVTDARLKGGSPAKWAGVYISGGLDAVLRPWHNPPSIGALEFVNASPWWIINNKILQGL